MPTKAEYHLRLPMLSKMLPLIHTSKTLSLAPALQRYEKILKKQYFKKTTFLTQQNVLYRDENTSDLQKLLCLWIEDKQEFAKFDTVVSNADDAKSC
jgi:hypothetical protein